MAWFRKTRYTTLRSPTQRTRIPEGMWRKCTQCLEIISNKEWEEGHKVCPKCKHHEQLSARERIAQLTDEGTFEEFDKGLTSLDPLQFVDSKAYPDRIRAAQEKTGETDAAVSGVGRIQGKYFSIAAMNFFFNGGSMGSVVGEKIARSIERGIERRIPVLNVCASGGARMQEGMFSLMQLAKTSAAVARLGQAGMPYFILMTNPTTAGVLASFASLGDVIIAEPDALVGFAGPRVIEATIKQILPPGFQRSEFVHEHGFIDMIVSRPDLRPVLARLATLLGPLEDSAAAKADEGEETDDRSHGGAMIRSIS
jgi:acetyl-CoA carboxylase carboxyl transferase subunit beta